MSAVTSAYQIKNGAVSIDGVSLSGLTQKFETPFYFYNLDHVRDRARLLKASLAKMPTTIHYAMKANANPALLRLLKSEGLHVDVVSGGEAECARRNGFAAADILFSGVAKSVRELKNAIAMDVHQINVESLGELERIEQILIETKTTTPLSIGLRLNPNVSPETHPYITTGLKENKFGLEEDAVFAAVDFLKKTKAPLRLRGLSLHIGSQLLELSALGEALEIGIAVQRRIGEKLGIPLDRFDAGGGIGIRYESIDEQTECDIIENYAALIQKHLGGEFQAGRIRELMIEPGRWLVARSGLLVAEVQYTKKTQHKSFVIVDAGMNLLIRPALYEAEHRIAPLETKATAPVDDVDVVGPICESADFLGRHRSLPHMKQGDRLVVFDAGAYGRTMASNYNQHGWPAEYIYLDGQVSRVDSN